MKELIETLQAIESDPTLTGHEYDSHPLVQKVVVLGRKYPRAQKLWPTSSSSPTRVPAIGQHINSSSSQDS